MKVGILAGGLGSRLAEETEVRPKPMVEIGGRPILWHIMRHYVRYGFDHFVIALGYKGEHIKRYMVDYSTYGERNLTVDMRNGDVKATSTGDALSESWMVDLIDTGGPTETGARIKRIAPYLGDGTFMLTYGDGVSDVNLSELVDFHHSHGKLATMTAVHPPARFGKVELDGNEVARFVEKPQFAGEQGPQVGEGWINGGFFVLEPGVDGLHRRRRIHEMGARPARAPREGRRADGLSPLRVLAMHGHPAGPEAAGTLVERRRTALDHLTCAS